MLVWATGFQAIPVRLLARRDWQGRRTLREAWDDDDARAYLGVTVPGFPNFFLLGGPNSFPGSGSFMYFMEVQMRYIARLLAACSRPTSRRIEADQEVYEEYNDLVDSHQRADRVDAIRAPRRTSATRAVEWCSSRRSATSSTGLEPSNSGLADYEVLGDGSCPTIWRLLRLA